MFSPRTFATLLALSSLALSSSVFAAGKTYQVTGPVLEATDSMIAVQKGKERWEIAKEPSTEVKGEIQPGTKVTVYYRMTAESIESKGSTKKAAKGKGK